MKTPQSSKRFTLSMARHKCCLPGRREKNRLRTGPGRSTSLEDMSDIRCGWHRAPVLGCRPDTSPIQLGHSALPGTSDSFRFELRCLRDTTRTADLLICGRAPELSSPGSCSKTLRSQKLGSTPVVSVWHPDHMKRSCTTVSRRRDCHLRQGPERSVAWFSAGSIAPNLAG